jgi:hypothetical protein
MVLYWPAFKDNMRLYFSISVPICRIANDGYRPYLGSVNRMLHLKKTCDVILSPVCVDKERNMWKTIGN